MQLRQRPVVQLTRLTVCLPCYRRSLQAMHTSHWADHLRPVSTEIRKAYQMTTASLLSRVGPFKMAYDHASISGWHGQLMVRSAHPCHRVSSPMSQCVFQKDKPWGHMLENAIAMMVACGYVVIVEDSVSWLTCLAWHCTVPVGLARLIRKKCTAGDSPAGGTSCHLGTKQ